MVLWQYEHLGKKKKRNVRRNSGGLVIIVIVGVTIVIIHCDMISDGIELDGIFYINISKNKPGEGKKKKSIYDKKKTKKNGNFMNIQWVVIFL